MATGIATTEQKALDNIGAEMSGSFEALACASVEKSDMIDDHTATITALITTMVELTTTNKNWSSNLHWH